ncbi:TetR/AcrR family transcriptional regulator [Labedella phragmitis]|uniref:TetR/AcrR family transcriptional regulator n=1 Tax=Labedella phragmitis TaxID=2498849 RepID=UPI00140D6DFF|nr:TetR/AcrR family transcriptional regulator [Labedella phragmitis]
MPKRRDAVQNHEKLLVAARAVIAERGIDAPLEEIARRADVGIATLYRNFASRDELVQALFERSMDEVDMLLAEIGGEDTAWESLVNFMDRLGLWLLADPAMPTIVTRIGIIDPDRRPAMRFTGATTALVAQAQADGDLRKDVTAIDIVLLATMLGSIGRYGDEYITQWRRQLDIVLDGLRPAGSPRGSLAAGPVDLDSYHRMLRRSPADA